MKGSDISDIPKDGFVELLGMKGYCKVHPHPSWKKDDKSTHTYSRFCSFPNEKISMIFGHDKKLRGLTGPGVTKEVVEKFYGLVGESFEDIIELDI